MSVSLGMTTRSRVNRIDELLIRLRDLSCNSELGCFYRLLYFLEWKLCVLNFPLVLRIELINVLSVVGGVQALMLIDEPFWLSL